VSTSIPRAEAATPPCRGRHPRIATDIPRVVKLEADALKRDDCTGVRISMFDREAGVWAITFTRESRRKAILMWTVEVDA
jgi:hypothetical protein